MLVLIYSCGSRFNWRCMHATAGAATFTLAPTRVILVLLFISLQPPATRQPVAVCRVAPRAAWPSIANERTCAPTEPEPIINGELLGRARDATQLDVVGHGVPPRRSADKVGRRASRVSTTATRRELRSLSVIGGSGPVVPGLSSSYPLVISRRRRIRPCWPKEERRPLARRGRFPVHVDFLYLRNLVLPSGFRQGLVSWVIIT